MVELFKSEQGKNAIFQLYEEKLEELNITYNYRTIDSSFGKTNLIVTGKPSNPPIIIVHGSNACAPIALETYSNLSQSFEVYAIDVLAQPNKSASTRLSMKDNSYGQWMHEIITSIGFETVTLAGFSFGGLVILKTLEYNESKIKEVFLSAPAYIVNGNPLKALFKIFIPMKRYMSSLKPKFVERFLHEVFSERDEFAIKFLSAVFQHFEMDFTPVPTISTKNAKAITTPITLIAAQNDLMFPGKKMIKRASKIFPSLRKHYLLENSKHVQSKKDNAFIEGLIMKNEPHLK